MLSISSMKLCIVSGKKIAQFVLKTDAECIIISATQQAINFCEYKSIPYVPNARDIELEMKFIS